MEDEIACPICTMTDLLDGGDYHECATCGHEFDKAAVERVVLDANGKPLSAGDDVTLIKDLKIDGKSGRLKAGSKIKSISLVDGDHPISGKVDGRHMLIRAEFHHSGRASVRRTWCDHCWSASPSPPPARPSLLAAFEKLVS